MLQKAISKAQEKIKGIQAVMSIANLLPESDLPTRINIDEDCIFVNLPYDVNIYRQYRKLLGENWRIGEDSWTCTQHGETSISRHINFVPKNAGYTKYWDGPYLKVSLVTDIQGSTCQVKQVGVKEVPILEVVCS